MVLAPLFLTPWTHLETFMASNPRTSVAAIVTRGSEVLLGCSIKEPIVGKWVIPGGDIEPFESIVTTVQFTLLEETGIIIKPGSVLFVSEVLNPPHDHRILIYVDAEFLGGALQAGENFSEVAWVDVRKLGDMQDDMSELTIDALHKFSLILRARSMQKQQGQFGPPLAGERFVN